MFRTFTLLAMALGACCLFSCVGKFSLIDEYYATPPEGEEKIITERVEVREAEGTPQLSGAESAVEVVEEEPIK